MPWVGICRIQGRSRSGHRIHEGDYECAPHSHPDAKSTDWIWEDCPKRREMDAAGNLDRSGWLMGSKAPAK